MSTARPGTRRAPIPPERTWIPALAAALALTLAGCCATGPCATDNLPPTADLATAEDTVKLFRYAVRNDCNGVAYRTLTAYTRDRVSKVELIVAKWFDIPGTDFSLEEAVSRGRIVRTWEADPSRLRISDAAREAAEELWFAMVRFGDQAVTVLIIEEKEDDRWRVGLVESAEAGLLSRPSARE